MRCDALNPKAVGPAQAPALAQFGVGGHKGFGDATAEHRADKGEKAEDEHEGIQLAGGAELVGDEIAAKVGQIWGIAGDGELSNMFRPTPQKGLWVVGGGLAHARIYTHYLALQIKAREAGLLAN